MRRVSRRTLLTVLGTGVVGLAGCLSSDSTDTGTTEPTMTAGPTPTTEAGTTPAPSTTAQPNTTATDELDLREANVVGVSVAEEGDGRYRFEVTLHHDDDGEDGYANWWQVETLQGEKLGRRELLHAHSQQPFTRSETVEIPAGVDCVVVRGHDQTHGYGGRVMLVTPQSGTTNAVSQGPDRRSLADEPCPGAG